MSESPIDRSSKKAVRIAAEILLRWTSNKFFVSAASTQRSAVAVNVALNVLLIPNYTTLVHHLQQWSRKPLRLLWLSFSWDDAAVLVG